MIVFNSAFHASKEGQRTYYFVADTAEEMKKYVCMCALPVCNHDNQCYRFLSPLTGGWLFSKQQLMKKLFCEWNVLSNLLS